MKILIAGTFDKFHVGHQFYVWKAYDQLREKREELRNKEKSKNYQLSTTNHQLTIIVARDEMAKKQKNHFPVYSEKERLKRLEKEFENFENVKIRLGREDGNFFKTIEEENPHKIILGYDQHFNEEEARKIFPQIIFERAESFNPEFFKSSKFL